MEKKGLVIAGFAGVGKTTLAKKYKNVKDVESSPYFWDYKDNVKDFEKMKGNPNRLPNKNFPINYITAIKNAQKEYDIVCVWLHPDKVEPYYKQYNIDYVICFPDYSAIGDYEKRLLERGNSKEFTDRVVSSFDMRYIEFMSNNHKKIILHNHETLEDALIRLGAVKNGDTLDVSNLIIKEDCDIEKN